MNIISSEPNSAAKGFFITSGFWMMTATLIGLTAAVELVAPDLLGNIAWLQFGRIRPIHVNLVLFGFLVPAFFGASLYFIPILCRTKLYSEKLANFTVLAWNLALAAIVITLMMGITQGREYAELTWGIDIAVIIALSLYMYNLIKTVASRKEQLLYVSIWYICGGVFLTIPLYALGNTIWVPSTGALTGVTDAIWLWFYGHNIFGFLITPLAVGTAYYIIPRSTRSPIYSHTLSLIGFWAIFVIYTHTGAHHLIQAPIPVWLKVIAIVDSMCLIIPVFTFLANVWLPLKDKWGILHENVGSKMVFVGTVFYFITCVQGPIQSLPSVQRLTHFNNWVVAHAHLALLGFAGMIAIGSVYYLLPLVTKREIYNKRLMDFQYWLVLFGILGFFIVLTIAGLIQGNAWLNGEVVYRVLPQISIYMILRVSLGVIVFVSAIIYFYLIVMTIYKGREIAR